MATRTRLNHLVGGTFSRGGGTHYDFDPMVGITAVTGTTRRTRKAYAVSECEQVISPADFFGAGQGLRLLASGNGALYGYNSANGNTLLRATSDPTNSANWAVIRTFANTIQHVHVTGTGRILAWVGAAGSVKVWRSDDGSSWTEGSETWVGAPYWFSIHEANGAIVAGTYRLTNNATTNELWRSVDNGASWTRALNFTAGTITHFHAVVYHPGTGQWFVDTGDGNDPLRRFFMKSADNGATWMDWREFEPLPGSYSPAGQCTRLRVLNDAELLFASDGRVNISRMNVTDHATQFRPLSLRRYLSNARGAVASTWSQAEIVWDVFQHGGIYYACVQTAAGAGNECAYIRVSQDLEHWPVYCRLADANLGVITTFIGEHSGWLWFACGDTGGGLNSFRVRPARIVQTTGLVLSPTKRNVLSASQASCSADWVNLTAGGGWDVPDNVTFDTGVTIGPSFTKSVRVTKTNPTIDTIYGVKLSANITATDTHCYVAHFYARGDVREFCVQLYGQTRSAYTYAPTRGANEWTEIWTPACSVGANQVLQVTIGAAPRTGQTSGTLQYWIGAAELVRAPFAGDWTPGVGMGGATTPGEYLDHTVTLPTHWTHVFEYLCLPSAESMGATHSPTNLLYLRTWRLDANNYITLFYDRSDWRFKLRSVKAGATEATIQSGVRWLPYECRLRFAVRAAGGYFWLSISDGQTTEHVGTLSYTGSALDGGGRIIRTGDVTGDNVLAGLQLDDYLYDYAMSGPEVEAVFKSQSISDAPIGGGGGVGLSLRRSASMNLVALDALTATGSDQAVAVPRGATLLVRPVGATAEVRDVAGGAKKLTIPADVITPIGPSDGQTVYIRAANGTVIELALT